MLAVNGTDLREAVEAAPELGIQLLKLPLVNWKPGWGASSPVLPALALGKGPVPGTLQLKAFHAGSSKLIEQSVLLDALDNRPAAADDIHELLQHIPDLEREMAERSAAIQQVAKQLRTTSHCRRGAASGARVTSSRM